MLRYVKVASVQFQMRCGGQAWRCRSGLRVFDESKLRDEWLYAMV